MDRYVLKYFEVPAEPEEWEEEDLCEPEVCFALPPEGAHLRERIGVIAPAASKSLSVYSLESWKELYRKMIFLDEEERDVLRRLFSMSGLAWNDEETGLLLPQLLRWYAGIEKEALLLVSPGGYMRLCAPEQVEQAEEELRFCEERGEETL